MPLPKLRSALRPAAGAPPGLAGAIGDHARARTHNGDPRDPCPGLGPTVGTPEETPARGWDPNGDCQDPCPGLRPMLGTPGRGWDPQRGLLPGAECLPQSLPHDPLLRHGAIAPRRGHEAHSVWPGPGQRWLGRAGSAPWEAGTVRIPLLARSWGSRGVAPTSSRGQAPPSPGKGDDIIPLPPLAPPLPRPARRSDKDGGVPPAPPWRSRALGGPGGGSQPRRPASPLPHAPLRHSSHLPLSAGAGGGASPEGSAGAGQRLRGGFSRRRAPAHHRGAGAVRRARLRIAAGRARRAGGGAAPALTPAACARSCSGSGRLCLCAARPPRSGAVRGGGGAGATPAPPGASLLLPGTVCRRRVHGDLTERALPHR